MNMTLGDMGFHQAAMANCLPRRAKQGEEYHRHASASDGFGFRLGYRERGFCPPAATCI
jgi:hypothetical protein